MTEGKKIPVSQALSSFFKFIHGTRCDRYFNVNNLTQCYDFENCGAKSFNSFLVHMSEICAKINPSRGSCLLFWVLNQSLFMSQTVPLIKSSSGNTRMVFILKNTLLNRDVFTVSMTPLSLNNMEIFLLSRNLE